MFNYTADVHYVCVCAHTSTHNTPVGIVLQSKQRLTIGSVDWMSGSCCNSWCISRLFDSLRVSYLYLAGVVANSGARQKQVWVKRLLREGMWKQGSWCAGAALCRLSEKLDYILLLKWKTITQRLFFKIAIYFEGTSSFCEWSHNTALIEDMNSLAHTHNPHTHKKKSII